MMHGSTGGSHVRGGVGSAASTPLAKKSQRRAHLKELMVQKVAQMYQQQTKQRLSAAKMDLIASEVERALERGTVSDATLTRIVTRLKTFDGRQSTEPLAPISTGGVTTQRHEDPPRPTPPPVLPRETAQTPRPPSSALSMHQRRLKAVQSDMWAKLSKKDLKEFEEEEKLRKQRHRERMLEQKRALDEQVELQKQQREQMRLREERSNREEMARAEQLRREAEQDEHRRREACEHEKRERDVQLRDLGMRKKHEEEQRRREEAMAAQRIKKELEAEQQAMLRRKLKAKEDIARYMEFNAEQRALKDQQKHEEHKQDKELHRIYIERLEKQERDRAETLRKMYARQSRQVAMGANIAATMAERAAEDERRAEKEQEKMMEKVKNEEMRRKQAILEEKEKIKTFLSEQIREKEKRRRAEREELADMRDKLMADVQQAENTEREKQLKKRQKDIQLKAEIEEQIRSKMFAPLDSMSKQERALNRQLLRGLSE